MSIADTAPCSFLSSVGAACSFGGSWKQTGNAVRRARIGCFKARICHPRGAHRLLETDPISSQLQSTHSHVHHILLM